MKYVTFLERTETERQNILKRIDELEKLPLDETIEIVDAPPNVISVIKTTKVVKGLAADVAKEATKYTGKGDSEFDARILDFARRYTKLLSEHGLIKSYGKEQHGD